VRFAAEAVFQVLLSTGFSLAGAIALVWIARRLLPVRDGRLALVLAGLPLAKAGYEAARGIPSDGLFWHRLGGATRELESLRMGLGITRTGPVVDLSFAGLFHGVTYPQSGGDVLATSLARWCGPHGLELALLVIILVAAILVFRRAHTAPRADEIGATQVVETRDVGMRRVAVVTSERWDGVPFASAVLEPRICFSASVYAALSPDERNAVIAHELGHIRGLHILVVGVAALVTRLLWFVPGARWLEREIATQCEFCADDAALRQGIRPELMAATLVKVAELTRVSRRCPALPFSGERSVLGRRVRHLLAQPSRTRALASGLRVASVLIVAATVLRATTFGNP
jgi:hypothetical protein